MGTILAKSIVERAQKILVDDGVRWTLNELLDWFNGGQRQIVLFRPDASSATKSVQLASGTKQSIPAGDWRLLSIVRNMGTDNNTPGRAITLVERHILDAEQPEWHGSTPNARVKHFTYDEREPRTFYVFPPQPSAGRGYVEMVVSVPPAECTMTDVPKPDGTVGTANTAITVDDVYENPLIDWIIFRAYSKEAVYANGGGKADQAMNRFYTALGVKTSSDRSATARANAPPQVNPNVSAGTGFLGGS